MTSIKKFSVIILILLASVALAQDKVKIDYKYEPGKTYHYRMQSSNSFIQELMGQENKGTTGISQEGIFSVESVDNEGLMHGSFEWQNFTTATKMMQIDTTIAMKDYIGKKSNLTITPNGNIAVLSSDSANVAIGMPGSTVGAMLFFLKLPEERVAVGDTFSICTTDTTYDQKNNQTITERTRKSKFESIEKTSEGSLIYIFCYEELTSSAGTVETMGMEMYQETEGTEKGTVRISGNGILLSQQAVSDKDMSLVLTGQMGMTIPMTIHEEREYKLVE
jgi:hypothetical protein